MSDSQGSPSHGTSFYSFGVVWEAYRGAGDVLLIAEVAPNHALS